jgi:hypothetical protein
MTIPHESGVILLLFLGAFSLSNHHVHWMSSMPVLASQSACGSALQPTSQACTVLVTQIMFVSIGMV